MVTNSKKSHFAAQGVASSQIIRYQNFTLKNLVEYNPGVGGRILTFLLVSSTVTLEHVTGCVRTLSARK